MTMEMSRLMQSFPWYDLPGVQWANDALWHATGLPGALDRSTPIQQQWWHSELVVSQACGLDLFLSAAPIEPVLAPVFDLDSPAGSYFSYLVGNPTGRVAAVNGLSSRSGLCALLAVCRPRAILITGSHRNSLAALRSGAAEVASIDAVTWTILERCDPAVLQGITRVDRTPSGPAPPFVMRRGGTHERIARALEAAMRGPATLHARRALGISGVVRVSLDDYLPVRDEYLALASRIPRILG